MQQQSNELFELSEANHKEYIKLLRIKFQEVNFDDVDYESLSEVNKIRFDLNRIESEINSSQNQLEGIESELIATSDKEERKLLMESKIETQKQIKSLKKEFNFKYQNIQEYYIKTHLEELINIYLCESESNELFIVKNLLNNSYQKCSKPKLINIMKIICMRYKNVAKIPSFYFNMKPQQFLDYCFNNNLIKETFDVGFKPSLDEDELKGLFYFEDKKLLNCYVPGEYESKRNKYILLKDHDVLTNQEIYKQFKFPLIDKLLKHLTGDKRIFYAETIELLSNEKYTKLAKAELFMIVNTLNLKPESNNFNYIKDYVIKYCQLRLDELNNDEEYLISASKSINYFYSWLAFIYQYPTFKIPNGIGFKTTQGSGKDITTSWVLSSIWGAHNIKSVGQTDLNEKFNGYIKGARFVICNELEYNSKNTQMYETLKRLMTNPSITLREMHKTQYNIPNFSHFLFFGNHDNMLRVEKGDRRLTIYEQNFICPKLIPYKLSPNSINEKGHLTNPNVLKNELNEFSRFLFNLKVSFETIERPLQTEIKTEIQEYHKSDIEQFLEKFKEFTSFEEMLEYYEHLDNVVVRTSKDDSQTNNKLRSFREVGNLMNIMIEGKEYNLIPNEILFRLFKAVCTEEGFTSRRAHRSFVKGLSQHNKYEFNKPQRCNVLGKAVRCRKIKDFIQYVFKKDFYQQSILEKIFENYNSDDKKDRDQLFNSLDSNEKLYYNDIINTLTNQKRIETITETEQGKLRNYIVPTTSERIN